MDQSPAEKNYSDYTYASVVIKRLIENWKVVERDAIRNRELRYIREIDPNLLRSSGLIKADETFIPNRVIDTNIRREQPQFIAYLTQSRRAVVFTDPSGATSPDMNILEQEFTNACRYGGWETPFIRCIDGAQTHGWDSVEVILDVNSPGHFQIEHVGNANLIFGCDSEDLEYQEIIIRKLTRTAWQLKESVKYAGFNQVEVDSLIGQNPDSKTSSEDRAYNVYKCFYKNASDGIVYVGWYSEQSKEWLKSPEPLFLGRKDIVSGKTEIVGNDPLGGPIMDFAPIYETNFPVFIFRYFESEDPIITQLKGRAYFDEPIQEAVTAIVSSIVNGATRACNNYAAPKTANAGEIGASSAPAQTKIVLTPGAIYDKPMEFFHTPWPDGIAIQIVDKLLSYNQQENAQINYTVLNRRDSGKTATEVASANQEAQKLSSVQVTNLSSFLRNVYTRCFEIYQTRAIAGLILPINQLILPLLAVTNPETGEISLVKYIVKPAGDVDVVQRADKLQRQQAAWGIIGSTPLASIFLKDMLANAFPEDAPKYIAEMDKIIAQQSGQSKTVIVKLLSVIQSLATDESGKLVPALQGMEGQLQALVQEAQGVINSQPTA